MLVELWSWPTSGSRRLYLSLRSLGATDSWDGDNSLLLSSAGDPSAPPHSYQLSFDCLLLAHLMSAEAGGSRRKLNLDAAGRSRQVHERKDSGGAGFREGKVVDQQRDAQTRQPLFHGWNVARIETPALMEILHSMIQLVRGQQRLERCWGRFKSVRLSSLDMDRMGREVKTTKQKHTRSSCLTQKWVSTSCGFSSESFHFFSAKM